MKKPGRKRLQSNSKQTICPNQQTTAPEGEPVDLSMSNCSRSKLILKRGTGNVLISSRERKDVVD
jgi:hypothetical protein